MESGRQDLDNDEMKESSRPSSVVPTCKSETDVSTPVSFDQQLKSHELLNMGKQNGGESDLDDGTKERMLTDESKISPTKDATEVISTPSFFIFFLLLFFLFHTLWIRYAFTRIFVFVKNKKNRETVHLHIMSRVCII